MRLSDAGQAVHRSQLLQSGNRIDIRALTIVTYELDYTCPYQCYLEDIRMADIIREVEDLPEQVESENHPTRGLYGPSSLPIYADPQWM